MLNYGVWFSSNTILLRKKNFDSNYLKNDAGSLSDMLLIVVLGLKHGVVVIDDYLGCFNIFSSSISHSVAGNNTSYKLLSILEKYLFESDITIFINKKVAYVLYYRNLYLCIIEHIHNLFENYKNNIYFLKKSLKYYSILLIFYLFEIFFKISFYLTIKPTFLFVNIKYKRNKATKNELNHINKYNLDNY